MLRRDETDQADRADLCTRRGRGRTRPVYVGFEMRRDLTASWGRGGWTGAVIVGFPDYLELCEWMRSGM